MEKLIELLKQKFSGIRPDVLAQLASTMILVATTEDEQKSMVEKLSQAQVEAFGKDYRKAVDTEVSNSTKTFEDNLKKKYDFVEKVKTPPTPPKKEEDKPQDDERFSAMQKTIEELKGTIAGMQKEGQSKVRSAKYGEILKGCKDENLKGILERQLPLLQNLDDDAFENELKSLQSDVDKSNQLFAERSLPTHVTTKTIIDEKQVSPGMKAYVDKMNGKTTEE